MSGAGEEPERLPTTTVVMATYRRRHLLPRVLPPLLADPALSEAVVVVDGCDDGSLELLDRMARQDDRLRPLWTENVGPSAAQQLGLEHARGDVVLMFDDDQIASPGLVTGHARHHAGAENLVVVGWTPIPIPARRRRGGYVAAAYAATYEDDCRRWERDPEAILVTLWGGNVSLRRDDLLAVGWHNPDFAHFYNYDQDFGLRCRRAGLHARFDRRLKAEHLYVRSPAAILREARVHGRARAQLVRTYPEARDAYALDRTAPRGRLRPLGRRPRFAPVARAIGSPLVSFAGRAGLFSLERQVGLLLWDLEVQRGMLEEAATRFESASRGAPASGTPPDPAGIPEAPAGPAHVGSRAPSRAAAPGRRVRASPAGEASAPPRPGAADPAEPTS
jgi:glycosyltransferase involved in cell wall biosynthesis